MSHDNVLSGRVVLISGGSKNIGRSVALELACSGADIAVMARHDSDEMRQTLTAIRARGRRALGLCADVADPEAIAAAINQLQARFGRLDGVVCCAAIRPHQPFEEISPAAWRDVLGTNLEGPFYLIQQSLALLKTSDQAAVVTFGGVSAHLGAARRAHVMASKMGVVGLTRALAVELAEYGITVNGVVPGQIETQRPAGSPAPQLRSGQLPPVGRMGQPEEIAAMVGFLLGPRGRYITGQMMHVNGGSYLG